MSENKIIVYHYPYSPFAKRVLWYLALRNITYSQCVQPPVMPRPDLAQLGVAYRRIPVMAIGRDIYCDTRLQLTALDAVFPASKEHPSISPQTPEAMALRSLFEKWAVDGGLFAQGSRLMPTDLPMLKDPKFQKDRLDFSGRSFSKEAMDKGRPEATSHVRDAFIILEESILSDGRQFVLGTDKPTVVDIEAVWMFHWSARMKGALDSDVISASIFPKTFAWIDRFDGAIKQALKAAEKPTDLKGDAATQAVLNASYVEQPKVDNPDPLRLSAGEQVEVWPIDTGFSRRDSGKLVGLDRRQIVIERKAQDGQTDVRVHFPRTLFRARKMEGSKL